MLTVKVNWVKPTPVAPVKILAGLPLPIIRQTHFVNYENITLHIPCMLLLRFLQILEPRGTTVLSDHCGSLGRMGSSQMAIFEQLGRPMWA